MSVQLETGAPPSKYAVASLLDGEPGALGRVASSTVKRMLLIAPGLWLAGFRDRELVKGTVSASVSITVGLIVYYAVKANRPAINDVGGGSSSSRA
jgi:hypothetical protein